MPTIAAIAADVETARAVAVPPVWTLPKRGVVGMWSFIIAESAIFTIFVVAYLFYLGKSLSGPTPRDVLEVPIFYTICLLSSSVTIHLAGRRLERNESKTFLVLWLITIALGAIFMFGTAQEWRRLIYEHGLTISTNLFGTTYYSLVGLHAFHVTLGLIMLTTMLLLSVAGGARTQSARIDVLSMYWHFVDVVWVVVFTVVYIIGR
jgi:cytochrome c oxidase subunit III